ncbi:S8 family serine peptidase [Clostridium sp. AM58-1XD]|uniref:S8 family serine peptidase n=1 Tax=Clostridium sp. AM58-1XD TaxID=2292307 RepID=UPI000E5332BD|nr:S8 family serine peptidase [Clostridium sp. AM58-1XD]RGZ00133.1 DUF5050 domain-containing protein [Clostridium sp. AM58-1XD]
MDYYQIEIEESDLETLKKTSRQLMEHDEVMFVSYDMVNEMSGSSPGGYSVEKGVINDEIERNSWWREAIELESAWEYEEYFSEIDVGIIDGFFDDEHPNLDLTVLNEENNNEGKKADSSTGELNHGTSVAGVIGAKRSNGIQIRGVAENADLYCYSFAYVVKMPDNGGEKIKFEKSSDRISVLWNIVANSDSKILNLSLGYTGEEIGKNICDERARLFSLSLGKLLDYYHDFIIVQSAGNKGRDAFYTMDFCSVNDENCIDSVGEFSKQDILDRIIVVGAAEQIDEGYRLCEVRTEKAKWQSCWGDQVDIVAPGRDIYTTIGTTKIERSQENYGYFDGTSAAAPVVSGVAALVWSVNPGLTGAEVRDIVCNSYNKLVDGNSSSVEAEGNQKKYHMVNARLSVERALNYHGNSQGNLNNRGFIAGDHKDIYFTQNSAVWHMETKSGKTERIYLGPLERLNVMRGYLYGVERGENTCRLIRISLNSLKKEILAEESYLGDVITDLKNIYYIAGNDNVTNVTQPQYGSADYIHTIQKNTSLYRMNLDGNNKIELIPNIGEISSFAIYNKKIYCQEVYRWGFAEGFDAMHSVYNLDGEKLQSFVAASYYSLGSGLDPSYYTVGINGNEEVRRSSDMLAGNFIFDNKMLYMSDETGSGEITSLLSCVELDDIGNEWNIDSILLEEAYMTPSVIDEGTIYYCGGAECDDAYYPVRYHDYGLYKMDLDGTKKAVPLYTFSNDREAVPKAGWSISVVGEWVYFKGPINGDEQPEILYRIRKDGSELQKIG